MFDYISTSRPTNSDEIMSQKRFESLLRQLDLDHEHVLYSHLPTGMGQYLTPEEVEKRFVGWSRGWAKGEGAWTTSLPRPTADGFHGPRAAR